MAVYKFRIRFEEFEDITRDIEVRSTQTFEDLHNAIQESIKFDNKQNASFYMSDDLWSKGEEIILNNEGDKGKDMPLMSESCLCDFIIDPHQKIYYLFDFNNPWTFYIELIKIIINEDKSFTYPRLVKSVHDAPKQVGVITLGNVSDIDLPEEVAEEEQEEFAELSEADRMNKAENSIVEDAEEIIDAPEEDNEPLQED